MFSHRSRPLKDDPCFPLLFHDSSLPWPFRMSTNMPNSRVDLEQSTDGNEIVNELDKRKESSASSECSVEVVDLEAGGGKVHLAKRGRDCRICHLSFDAGNQDSGGLAIELGCSCKNDLAAAHKQCAEAWFKIKGNK